MTVPKYSLILPALKEEANLRLLLPQITTLLDSTGVKYEVIVVDSVAKLDNTASVCRANKVMHVARMPTDSFGDAVRTGIRVARGEYIVFMDADGSHDPSDLPRLIAKSHSSDIVIASRYTTGGATEYGLLLTIMSRLLNSTYALAFGLKVADISTNYKLYRASLLKRLNLISNNFDIIEELLIKIKLEHPKVTITEIPSTFKNRKFGKTKRSLLLFMLTYLVTMFRLKLVYAKKSH